MYCVPVTQPSGIDDAIASQVRRYRLLKNWSVRQLAEECQKLGAPQLTSASLGNIERGQAEGAKRARRRVLVSELIVLARALQVPPVLLVIPLGHERTVAVAPDLDVDTWDAAKWFTGEAPLPRSRTDEREAWERGAMPIDDYRWHDHYLREREASLLVIQAEGEPSPDLPEQLQSEVRERIAVEHQRIRRVEQQLREHRQQMRRRGLAMPALPAVLAKRIDAPPSVDDPPRAFARPPLTPGRGHPISARQDLKQAIIDAGGEYIESPPTREGDDSDGGSDQAD